MVFHPNIPSVSQTHCYFYMADDCLSIFCHFVVFLRSVQNEFCTCNKVYHAKYTLRFDKTTNRNCYVISKKLMLIKTFFFNKYLTCNA